MKLYFGKHSSFFLVGKTLLFIFIFCSASFISCKKEKPPSTPGAIAGPKNLCPGETGITYSINPVEGSTFYLWTVPDDARIVSGQGTTSIIISFGKSSGSICVRSNNKKEYSDASCIEVTQGGVANTWCREMDFKGGGRTQGIGFSIGKKGYIGTGVDPQAGLHQDFWEFDPALNTWTQKIDFGGVGRTEAVGFSIGNKGYIGTGYTGLGSVYLKDFWEYDPLSNLWSIKDSVPGPPRQYAFCFSIGDKGYIGSGSNAVLSALTDFYEFDPALNRWARKADVVPRNVGVGFSIENYGYLGMGNDGSSNHNDFWKFDPNDSSNGVDEFNNPIGKWTQKATFPGVFRYAGIGFSMGNKGYMGLGYDGTNYFSDFFEYTPDTDTWLQKTDFAGDKRAYAPCFAIGKNGYVGTGDFSGAPLSSFWVYGQ